MIKKFKYQRLVGFIQRSEICENLKQFARLMFFESALFSYMLHSS